MNTDADKVVNYRQRAQHLRLIAEGIASPESRELMLGLAKASEHLADTIEMRVGVLLELKSQNSR
jgi:hypothetical protein